MRSKLNGENGFTIVELLLAITLLAIIAAVTAMPSSSTVDMESGVIARQMLATIRYAKVGSLAQREVLRVVFDVPNNSVRVEDDSGNVVWNPVAYAPYVWALDRGQIESASFAGDNYIEFGSTGEVMAGGTAVIQYPGLTQTYTVSPMTGRVAVDEVRN